MVRINKYLASCNLGSRREVEKLISSGDIIVNGCVCKNLSTRIDPVHDTVKYQGKILNSSDLRIYILLNKPRKYLVSTRDEFDRKTIFSLLPELDVHLFPVGRLDYDSEGLLLISNDGDFSNSIIHPRFKLPKLYKVTVDKELNPNDITRLRTGLIIDGKKTLPAKVFVKKSSPGFSELRITLVEGRKRQIRRMLSAVSAQVLTLKRLQIGNLKLGNLPTGQWRFLNDHEVRDLLDLARRQMR